MSNQSVTGYRLYYGTSSRTYGNAVAVGNAASYTATGLQAGRTYYFAVTSVDGAGNESGFSNEASKLIQ